jgi:hypothetical protein
MGDFFKKKVLALPDGTQTATPIAETGLVLPKAGVLVVDKDTTYSDLYLAMYKSYDFPKQSLRLGKCVAFCPDGTASVNGLC